MPRTTLLPKCDEKYNFNKESCLCVLKDKHRKLITKPKLLVVDSLKSNPEEKYIRIFPKGKTVKKTVKKTIKKDKSKSEKDLDKVMKLMGKKYDNISTQEKKSKKIKTIKKKNKKTIRIIPAKGVRCPKGMLKNRYTKKCERKADMKEIQISDDNIKKPHCKKGTYRSKITNNCEPHNITRKKRKDRSIIIDSSNTPEKIRQIGNEVRDSLSPKAKMSYRPSVVRSLNLVKRDIDMSEYISDLDCNDKPTQEQRLVTVVQLPRVSKCLNYNDERVKKHMLQLLENSIRRVDPSIIISPRQYQSNCWFNTMFVSFFISDYGRKFFSYFRQMMILGNAIRIKGTVDIKPAMRKALFNLNLMIHKSLTGKLNTIDTNLIIKTIYANIPRQGRYNKLGIVAPGKANNPLSFYYSLMRFLNNTAIKIDTVSLASSALSGKRKFNEVVREYVVENIREDVSDHHKIKTGNDWKFPDIIVVEIRDDESKDKKVNPKKIKIDNTSYSLDSVILRDTKAKHFCCGITINSKEYIFDGNTYTRMEPFRWSDLLVSLKKFKFGYRTPTRKEPFDLEWSFRKGYQMLIYYRTK